MQILVTSDLHGNLPDIKIGFDLLLICGDICPAHDHYYTYQKSWVENEFVNWINTLQFNDEFSRVIVIPGNHDFVFERFHKSEFNHISKLANNKIKFLKNELYDHEYLTDEGLKNIKIYGTPYCHRFGNWAFMIDDDKLRLKYQICPDNVDIYMSHDAPNLNDLGVIQKGFQTGINAGNEPLAESVKKVKPKMFFCGHIHSGNHDFTNVDGTYMANVSYIDESYYPTYDILSINYDNEIKNFEYINVNCKYMY